jgi:hypothetical protein
MTQVSDVTLGPLVHFYNISGRQTKCQCQMCIYKISLNMYICIVFSMINTLKVNCDFSIITCIHVYLNPNFYLDIKDGRSPWS